MGSASIASTSLTLLRAHSYGPSVLAVRPYVDTQHPESAIADFPAGYRVVPLVLWCWASEPG